MVEQENSHGEGTVCRDGSHACALSNHEHLISFDEFEIQSR